MVQVAPSWHPMLQPPIGQLRIVQVAPAAHWISQAPAAQVSITQVAPEGQSLMPQPIWHVVMVHLPPGPHLGMLQPPEVQAPRVHTELAPSQVSMQPPVQVSMVQVLPAPQELT
jgi:hypothetical protein